MKRVRRRPRTRRAHRRRRRSTSPKQRGPVDRAGPASASDVAVGTGSSSRGLVDVDADPDHGQRRRPGVSTRSTRMPADLAASPTSTSLGHFSAARRRPSARRDGVPGQQRQPRPPLGVDDRVEARPRTSGPPGRASPTSRSSRPRPAGLVVGAPRPMAAPGAAAGSALVEAASAYSAHLPPRAGDRLEGGRVERRPAERAASMALDWRGRREEATQ